MSDYIMNIRKLVGSMPLVICTAGAIIIDNKKRVLLQHRIDNDTWGLPGGIIEPGEAVEDAAIREVYEETGLIVEELKLFNIYSGASQHYIYPNGDEVHLISITYITTRYSGKIKIDGIETKDIKFFDIHSLPSNITPPVKPHLDELKERIKKLY